ncbi:hypothetical protein [Flavobacterium sp. Leaf359]|uniref:hypothetical protein n=1 Tax=Flavobacterium sp. Leaf359 TaxID=1736351 RepID=UPI000A5D6967|nr:hypothetical protein [Flavobacterium sp. Leaf359]
MASIMKITFLERNDADDIAKKISDSVPMEIEIENSYAELKESSISVNDMDTATLAALYKLSDACTYTFEDGAYVFVVRLSGKDFDLTDSYIRDAADIVKPMPAIPDGTVLMARFEIPGFGTNSFREIPVWYNTAFDPADLVSLSEIGISLTGDGGAFTITNNTDCRVGFFKPETAPERYIIDYDGEGQVIQP